MGRGNDGNDIGSREQRAEGDIDRLIEETEDAIRNTRSFLEHLRASEHNARDLVDSLQQRLEKDLRILQKRSESET